MNNNITNAKIEKVKAEIAGTMTKMSEIQAKLRRQARHLRDLEDMEIVARYRNEMFSDSNYAAIDQPRGEDTTKNEKKEELLSEQD